MKALNTLYAGSYFRSRTEARWAVYFDLIGVEWEYEKEGYDLGDGVKYLPDFWFPKHKMYGEVKATNDLTDVEVDKAKRLSLQSKREVVILSGPPHCGVCTVFNEHGESFGVPFADELFGKYGSVYYGSADSSPDEIGSVAALTASMSRFEHDADTSRRSRLRILNHEQEWEFPKWCAAELKKKYDREIVESMNDAALGRYRKQYMDELFGKSPLSTFLRPRQPVRIKGIER